MIRSADTLLKAHSWPLLSSGMVAALATVSLAEKFSVETSGWFAEQFHIVRKPEPVGPVTVHVGQHGLGIEGNPSLPGDLHVGDRAGRQARRANGNPSVDDAGGCQRSETRCRGARRATGAGATVAAAESTVKLQLTLRADVLAATA